jgi:uncharacterized protein YhbP (UPF0306 family)
MSTPNAPASGITRFLTRQHVLSLATASAGEVWCANCFYVFDVPEMLLYLMTEPDTRHGQMMASNPKVTGTIAYQTRTVTRIQGIQFRGEIHRLQGEAEAQARASYCQRFPVARRATAPVWRLALQEIKMTDNTLGFGEKRFWVRDMGHPTG